MDKVNPSKSLNSAHRVPVLEGFYFYREIGDPTGVVALSLNDFLQKLQTIDSRSIEFHFHRRDFEKWIEDVIGDDILSQRIGEIRRGAYAPGELRQRITRLVQNRVSEY